MTSLAPPAQACSFGRIGEEEGGVGEEGEGICVFTVAIVVMLLS